MSVLLVALLLLPTSMALAPSPGDSAGAVEAAPPQLMDADQAEAHLRMDLPPLPVGWLHRERVAQQTNEPLDGDDTVWVVAAGDLDGDGHDDLWRLDEARGADGSRFTLLALRGPGLGEALYRFTADSIMLLGDATGDGVRDFAIVTMEGAEDDGHDVYAIHDGSTGTEALSLRLPRWERETTHTNRTPATGPIELTNETTQEHRSHVEYPVVTDDGYLIVALEYYQRQHSTTALVGTSFSSEGGFETSVRRLDSMGNQLWSIEADGDRSYRLVDIDLDGELDVLGRLWELTYEAGQFEMNLTYDAIDGKSGDLLWTFEDHQSGDGGFYISSPTPSLRAHGAVPELVYRTMEGEDVHILILNALNGKQITRESIASTTPWRVIYQTIGDINKDGLQEIAFGNEDSLEVRSGAGKVYWQTSEAASPVPDLNGDGIDDIRVTDEEVEDFHVAFLSGRTGKTLWSFTDANAFSYTFTGDLNGDGGSEVLVTAAPDADEGDGDYGTQRITSELLRGSDGVTFWHQTIYHPDEFVQVAAPRFHVSAFEAGDLDGNGADDLALNIWTFFAVQVSCVNGDCTTTTDRPPGDQLSSVRIFDPATGNLIYRADAMTKTPYVAPSNIQVETAAEDLQKEVAGTPWTAILAGVGAAAIVLATLVVFLVRR